MAEPRDITGDTTAEWLETDGLGGFACGTVSGVRTRRYHALLVAATKPPLGRMTLVNGVEVWISTPAGRYALTSHRYLPDVIHPDGARHLTAFTAEPWPRWQYTLPDGTGIEQELFVPHGHSACVLAWRATPGRGVTLDMRPLLSGRDYHATHHENSGFRFDPRQRATRVIWTPYDGVPGVEVYSNGDYEHSPDWYRSFSYSEELARGLDHVEDLASPGIFRWRLAAGDAVCLFATQGQRLPDGTPADAIVASLRAHEQRRRSSFPSPLHRAADAFIVSRGQRRTIVAGYPWFTDWGRDTFIAMRGLCLATGRLDDAGDILEEWAGTLSGGMAPNDFGDRGGSDYNSVDASLWFVVAVDEFLRDLHRRRQRLDSGRRQILQQAVGAILTAYADGTRYGIRADADGLLACGTPGVQLTWMDARVGDRVVTPRVGKPVEVQALWLNALRVGAEWFPWSRDTFARGHEAFERRFWNPRGYLNDVVDVDHHPGLVDETLRPNQVLALGGLPVSPIGESRARHALQTIEERLLTPLGLRTLAPDHPDYVTRYEGAPAARDAAYHQGTVWPWLIGPFVDAWLRVHGPTPTNAQEARERFVAPLLRHLDEAGLGHVSEVADGDHPFTPRGCPFQAWSLGELLRIDALLQRAEGSAATGGIQATTADDGRRG